MLRSGQGEWHQVVLGLHGPREQLPPHDLTTQGVAAQRRPNGLSSWSRIANPYRHLDRLYRILLASLAQAGASGTNLRGRLTLLPVRDP